MEDVRRIDCPCRRTKCPRHGDCAACREHHRATGRKGLTYCEKRARKQARKAERQQRREGKRSRPRGNGKQKHGGKNGT